MAAVSLPLLCEDLPRTPPVVGEGSSFWGSALLIQWGLMCCRHIQKGKSDGGIHRTDASSSIGVATANTVFPNAAIMLLSLTQSPSAVPSTSLRLCHSSSVSYGCSLASHRSATPSLLLLLLRVSQVAAVAPSPSCRSPLASPLARKLCNLYAGW